VPRARRILALGVTALVLFSATSAFGVDNGLYRGSVVGDSSQDLRVKVRNGRVTKFLANVYASCGYANLFISVVYPPVGARSGASIRINSNNRFRATFVGNPAVPDDIRTITGRFQRSSVTGTIKVVGPCTSDDQYTARR
jgi:hypothetical protein